MLVAGVVVGRADLEKRGVAVGGNINGVRLLAQPFGQDCRRLRFVFDEQDPHVSVHDTDLGLGNPVIVDS